MILEQNILKKKIFKEKGILERPGILRGFYPDDLSELAFWVHVDPEYVKYSEEDNLVNKWKSREGDNYEITQTTGSRQPVVDFSARKITFDATDYLDLPAELVAKLKSLSETTIFIVHKTTVDVSSDTLFSISDSTTGSKEFAIRGADIGILARNGVANWDGESSGTNEINTSLGSLDNIALFTYRADGSTSDMSSKSNGSSDSITNSVSLSFDNCSTADVGHIGANEDSSSVQWKYENGSIYEIIIYGRGLSDSEITTVENYLKSKHSINF